MWMEQSWGSRRRNCLRIGSSIWRVPLISTTNKWDYSHLDAADKDWIEANCVPVHISKLVWDETPQPKPASPGESGRRPVRDVRVGPSPERKVRKTFA